MSKCLSLFFALPLLFAAPLNAQTSTYQISAGAGYAQSGYYKLADGTSQQVAYDDWDLAFSNLGINDVGIFFNESTASSMGQATPAIEVYDPFVFDFSENINSGDLTDDQLLYNPEVSWAEGAFNTVKDTLNPLDHGWGAFNDFTQMIEGYRVFVIKLRNGQYRKIIFDTYDGSAYTFRVADLDGSNEQSHTVNNNFGNGSPVVYFSFANGANVTTPTGWDLVFCRYITPLFDGTGYLPHPVTGILVSDGIQTAKATGVDPASVDYHDYLDSLKTRLDVIGHDWKVLSGFNWSVPDDVAYFVKKPNGDLYKLVFIAFAGSGTGTGTLEQTYLGQLSSAPDLPAGIQEVLVYPNPVAEKLTVSFVAERSTAASLQLFNANGQLVWEGNAHAQTGLNVLEISNLPALSAGPYILNVKLPNGQFSRTVMVGR
ncbi:MAG: HmuY family protein [Saprospiraceae bacterium]